jgi:ferredoxin-NADP reductase
MSGSLEVRGVEHPATGLFILTLERGDLTFEPGDCVALFAADGVASRPYSIASGTQDAELRFLIRRMDGGEVSPYLSERQPGDRVKVTAPFGWFRPAAAPQDAVYVATGTGVAPFVASLRSAPACQPLACFYGVRQRADAVVADWLRDRCPLHLAVSRETAADAVQGRVTDLLDRMPLGDRIDYYLCGLDAMIDTVTAWLEQQGVAARRIHRECFFNAD